MKTIGIPKTLLYYHYHTLWKTFFDVLDVPYIESGKSTKELLKMGQNKAIDETCLSMKLFFGHIEALKGKCDLLLIPRIYSLEKKEQVCTNFNALYDLVHNLYSDIPLLNYNIDVKRHQTEKKAFLKLGRELGFSILESQHAYNIAKEKEKEYIRKLEQKGEEKLKSKKTKILLLGHPYTLEDELMGKRITTYLKEQDVEVIYSYEAKRDKIDNFKKISKTVHWTMNKELLGAFSYFSPFVDGVILITAFPCGPDSLTNEMILRKKKNTKVLLLTFEDLDSDVAIITRLESFLDMLKGGIHL